MGSPSTPQNQGNYDDIRDKVNASIAAGELPAALLVGYQNDQSFYQLNDILVDLNTADGTTPKWGLSAEEVADFYTGFPGAEREPALRQPAPRLPAEPLDGSSCSTTRPGLKNWALPARRPRRMSSRKWPAPRLQPKGDGTRRLHPARRRLRHLRRGPLPLAANVLTEDGKGYVYNGPATVEAMTFLKGMLRRRLRLLLHRGLPEPASLPHARASSPRVPPLALTFYAGDVATR
jgi:hypothetical protein